MLVRPLVADVHVACCVAVLLLEGLGQALTSVLGIRFLGGLVARHLLDHSDDFLVHGHDHDEGGRAESPDSADRRPDVEPVVVEDVRREHRARPDADEEDPLPGYTPSSNFGDCGADGLVTAYEKVVDVTYNRGTVTELTTRYVVGIVDKVATKILRRF